MYTNRYGNAAVEMFNSNNGIADVIADFVDEGILRSIKVNFNVPGSSSRGGRTVTPPPVVKAAPKPHPGPAFKLGPCGSWQTRRAATCSSGSTARRPTR